MALARAGGRHRVAVFRREGFFLGPVESCCGPVHLVDIHSIHRWHTWAEIKRLSEHIRRERIDVVHAWDADAAIFGAWAAARAGVPLITSRRDMGTIYPRWKLALMRYADRKARKVVVNAEAIANQLTARHVRSDKVVTVPNLLDLDEFDELSKTPFVGLPEGRRMVLVSRLDPEKDVALAIKAFARLRPDQPDVHLIIAGDGKERFSLSALAETCKVADRVHFLGDVTDVPGLLKACEIGILTPKSNEGLSNTILEYMAARLPTVATDCGGNRELVRDGETGCLVPVGDVNGVALAMNRLLGDQALARRCGAQARAIVEMQHRPGIVAARFSDVYQSIF